MLGASAATGTPREVPMASTPSSSAGWLAALMLAALGGGCTHGAVAVRARATSPTAARGAPPQPRVDARLTAFGTAEALREYTAPLAVAERERQRHAAG